MARRGDKIELGMAVSTVRSSHGADRGHAELAAYLASFSSIWPPSSSIRMELQCGGGCCSSRPVRRWLGGPRRRGGEKTARTPSPAGGRGACGQDLFERAEEERIFAMHAATIVVCLLPLSVGNCSTDGLFSLRLLAGAVGGLGLHAAGIGPCATLRGCARPQ